MLIPQGKTSTNLVAIIQNLMSNVPNGRIVKSFEITGYTQEGESNGELVLPIFKVTYEDDTHTHTPARIYPHSRIYPHFENG